jgi:hypothetical protein
MRRLLGSAAALAIAATTFTTPAAGQLQSLPVFYSPKGGTGVTIAGHFGKTIQTKINDVKISQALGGEPLAIGGYASLGFSMLTVGVGAGIFDPKVSLAGNEVQYMGNVAIRVVGGALVPVAVSLQGGAGFLKTGTGATEVKSFNFPIGLGVGLNVPTPGFSFEPWVAPRVHLSRSNVTGLYRTQVGYGASAGINLGLPIGLGLHAAADWVTFSRKTSGTITLDKVVPLTIGVGLHYTFKLPGLPGVPVVPGA